VKEAIKSMKKGSVNSLLTLMAAFSVAACGSLPAVGSGNSANGDVPVHVSVDSDRFEIITPAQMCGVVLVADGNVSAYAPGHWNTGNGKRPAGLDERGLIQQGYSIMTPIRLSAMTADRDRRTLPTAEYVVLGGMVGQDSWKDTSFPHPRMGLRVLMVFVPSQVPGGTFTQQSLTLFEAFPIDSAGMVTLLPQTIEQGKVSQSEVKVSLIELRNDLSKCPSP
jgi:hypothetical protein